MAGIVSHSFVFSLWADSAHRKNGIRRGVNRLRKCSTLRPRALSIVSAFAGTFRHYFSFINGFERTATAAATTTTTAEAAEYWKNEKIETLTKRLMRHINHRSAPMQCLLWRRVVEARAHNSGDVSLQVHAYFSTTRRCSDEKMFRRTLHNIVGIIFLQIGCYNDHHHLQR